jgi:hypothetical protein
MHTHSYVRTIPYSRAHTIVGVEWKLCHFQDRMRQLYGGSCTEAAVRIEVTGVTVHMSNLAR